MGASQIAAGCNSRDGAHELNRCGRHCSLTDAYRDSFTGIPLLLEVLDLPFFRRHHAGRLLGKIDAGLLAESETHCIFRNASNTEFFAEGVEEDVTRLVDSLLDSNV